jgi:hypothetical protein
MRLARVFILGIAAVAAFGAMSTGTALAGLLAHWLVNGKLIGASEHVAYKFTSGLGRLWTTASKVVIHCNKDKGEGTLLAGNLGRVTKSEFEECQALEAKKNAGGTGWEEGTLLCTVPNVVLKPAVSLLGFTLSLTLANRFAPETGSEFTSLKFSASCPGELKEATIPITGQATGTFLTAQENKEQTAGSQVFAVTNATASVTQNPEEWLSEADESSSAVKTTLKFGSATSAFESTETVELTSKEPFGALK